MSYFEEWWLRIVDKQFHQNATMHDVARNAYNQALNDAARICRTADIPDTPIAAAETLARAIEARKEGA